MNMWCVGQDMTPADIQLFLLQEYPLWSKHFVTIFFLYPGKAKTFLGNLCLFGNKYKLSSRKSDCCDWISQVTYSLLSHPPTVPSGIIINQFIINNISLPQAPHSHIPYGEDGSGYYSENTIGTYSVIQECVALAVKAIRSIPIKPTQVFTIADYGCADGGTSMPFLYSCLEELRRIHGSELAVHVMYEDQPVNDFKALFLRLQGISLNRVS